MTAWTMPARAGSPRTGVTERSPLSALASAVTLAVGRQATLAEVAATMERHGVSSLLVSGGGIVTERDVVRAVGHGTPPTASVDEIATAHPVVVSGAVSITEGCAAMLAEGIRHLVVDIGGGQLGVVSMRDVLAVLIHSREPQVWLSSLRLVVPDSSETTEIWLG